jgi:hypothetical protein
MIKKLFLFSTITAIIVLASCRQIQEALMMARCEFRLKNVESLKLDQIDILKVKSISDISIADMARLGIAFAAGTMPLNLKLNVDVRNPNTQKAALSRLDWMLLIDQSQVAEGSTNYRIEVQPNGGISTMPLVIGTDLKKVLNGQTLNSLINLVLNICDAGGKPTRLTLKAKPWINIGNTAIAYPGYINIKTEFTSQ